MSIHSKLATAFMLAASVTTAMAADKLVVSSFGGIWQQSIEKNFGACYKDATKKDIAVQLGDPSAWMNRIRANPSEPPIDIVTLAQADVMRAIRAGMLEPIRKDRVPNLKQIPASHYEVWKDQAVQVHTAALGVLYDKSEVGELPKDWRTLLDNIAAGKYGKRVSMPAGTYAWGPDFIWFVSQTYGGNVDTGFSKLKAMMPSVVKFWTEPSEAINLFASKQIDILVYWDGRSYDYIEKGNAGASYYNPGPKSLGTAVSFAKVKNSSDAGWDFINCALSAKAQLGHAQTLGYGITNSTVEYPEALKKRITPTSEMAFVPYDQYLDQFPGWIDRWNREMR